MHTIMLVLGSIASIVYLVWLYPMVKADLGF